MHPPKVDKPTKADTSSPDKLRVLPNKESVTFSNSKGTGGHPRTLLVNNYYFCLFHYTRRVYLWPFNRMR